MLSQSISQSNSPSPESPQGLDLFLARVLPETEQIQRIVTPISARSRVITPFKHDEYHAYERYEGGLPNQRYQGANRFEIDTIWRMLREPAATEAGVLERQAVVRALSDDKEQLAALWNARSAAYRVATIIPFLLSTSNSEDRRCELTRERPRHRLRELVDEKFTCDEAKIQEIAAKIVEQPEEVRYRRPNEQEEREGSIEKLAAVSTIKNTLLELAAEFGKSNHQIWRDIGADFASVVEKLPKVTASSLMQAATDKKYELLSDLKDDYGETLVKSLSRVCALVVVCKMIEAGGFSAATVDRNEPEQFTRAWNVLKERGPGTAWSQKEGNVNYQQVMNCSPKPQGEIYLCGSNMSGKSFALDTWFYLRDWGQTFGFIPAESGNIHVTGAMAFMHRLGSDVGFHGKSSFQGEVERGWVPLLSELAPGSIAYFDLSGDEAFSTTSPVDQYRLLVGLTCYARARGVKVVMAVHNGEFLEFKRAQPDVGLYHFGVDKGVTGRIRYTHDLVEGIDQSHALEVARRMNVPPHILEHAAEFIAGRPPALDRDPRTPWVLERYTEEERERMKKEDLHFRFLWPECSHVVVTGKRESFKDRPLHWHTDSSEDHSRSGFGEPHLAPNRKSVSVIASSDNSMSRHAYCFRVHSGETLHLAHKAGDLIFAGPSEAGGSKEVLERQRLFEELQRERRADRLLSICDVLQSTLWSYQHAFNEDLANFPQNIFSGIAEALPRRAGDMHPLERWEILPLTIRMIEEGMGITFDGRLAVAARQRYERLLPYLAREHQIVEHYHHQTISKEEVEEALQKLGAEAGIKTTITRALWSSARLFGAQADAQLEQARLSDIDAGKVASQAERLYTVIDVSTKGGLFVDQPLSRVHRAAMMFIDRPYIREILNTLRETDSVYAHGFANYFERISDSSIGADVTGRKLLPKVTGVEKIHFSEEQRERIFGRASPHDKADALGLHAVDYLRVEVTKIQTLARLAVEIREEKFCKVEFNDTGAFVIRGGRAPANNCFNIENEVRNDTVLENGIRSSRLPPGTLVLITPQCRYSPA